jgi:hypothetical protein
LKLWTEITLYGTTCLSGFVCSAAFDRGQKVKKREAIFESKFKKSAKYSTLMYSFVKYIIIRKQLVVGPQ